MSFRVEKIRQEVELHQTGKDPVKGFVFLSRTCSAHHGGERVIDLLSGKDTFFPFENPGGKVRMVSKKSVRMVVVPSEFELELIKPYGKDAYRSMEVEVTMLDGNKVTGTLLIEPRQGASRSLDEMNRRKGFLLLKLDQLVHLIGTEHVASVQEVNGPEAE